MIYTIIVDGKSYDLPKRTLAVIEKMENVVKLDENKKLSIRQKYQQICNFLSEILGADNAVEILGGDNLDDMDVSDMLITFKKIVAAYNKPVQDYETASGFDVLSQLPIDKLNQLIKLSGMVQDHRPSQK